MGKIKIKMRGKTMPQTSPDAEQKCPALIEFGDDFGDNLATFHCELPAGHDGQHRESGNMGYGAEPIMYRLQWDGSHEKAKQERIDAVNEYRERMKSRLGDTENALSK